MWYDWWERADALYLGREHATVNTTLPEARF